MVLVPGGEGGGSAFFTGAMTAWTLGVHPATSTDDWTTFVSPVSCITFFAKIMMSLLVS
jgi:hypothetical protein